MIIPTSLSIYVFLLLVDFTTVSAEGIFSRVHGAAVKHTHSLARDLRLAFGGPAPLKRRQQQTLSTDNNHAEYCIANPPGIEGSSSSASSSKTATATSSGSSATATFSTPWKLVKEHSGSSFFDDWTFWTTADPTNGIVDYLSQSDASAAGILSVNDDGHAIMAVETTQTVSSLRKSVRITTNDSYNSMLVLMDSVHMPTGCGTWPAFWSNGPNWPQGGEIDIVEGVNDYIENQATVHTNPGCNLPSNSSSVLNITGSIVGGTNCAAAETENQGCGVRFDSNVSFGSAFNSNGGGVYAMQWDSDGIAVYFWARDEIPDDITAGTPAPSTWSIPQARWPATDCNATEFFYQNVVIFDTTLCGDWAGSVWSGSGIPGQETSCATRTGYSTCSDFVLNNGSSFADAYWEVAYVKIYQT